MNETKAAKTREGMLFLSARIRADKPSRKAIEKARRLPPFLIRVF